MARSCCARLGSGACCLCAFAVKVNLYIGWIMVCEYTALWSRFTEVPWSCDHPPLPENTTGVKVLVAGFAKTGTRTMSRSLYQIGLDHSYHSEEFGMFVWHRVTDKYWLRKYDNDWGRRPMPGSMFNINNQDAEVLSGTAPKDLAAEISRCRVDALAFDGLERLLLPIYDLSPGAKVILMNWRTFKEYRQSLEKFMPELLFEIVFLSYLLGPGQALPWFAVFVRAVDFLSGGEIQRISREGGPPICQVFDFPVAVLHSAFANRRVTSMWFSGMSMVPESEEEYNAYYQQIKDVVPPEDLIEWDMRKYTFEDLCGFLKIEPCPKSGRMPRARNNFIFVRDFPETFAKQLVAALFMHWVNWKLLGFFLGLPCRLLSRRGAPIGEDAQSKKDL